MTKVSAENLRNAITKRMKKTFSTSVKATAISLLFLLSGIGASFLVTPVSASPNASTAAALATTPVTGAAADWLLPGGNQYNWYYNSANQINSSDAQYLGISWLYPLPTRPTPLAGFATGGVGVNMAVLIVNGTAFATSVFDETIAFNVANGNVLWTYTVPLNLNSTVKDGAMGARTATLSLHSHDGNEWFTTSTFGSGVQGPTLWFQGQNEVVYALNALTGKQELNFSDFTGRSMVPGDGLGSTYHAVGASNIIIDQSKGILVSSIDTEISADNGRGFYAGWNLNANPPALAWVSFLTPPQPGGNLPLDPNWDVNLINNMSYAYTFFPGKGAANGYTTATELQGGLMTNTNDNLVVNWKSLSPSQLNQTLYNDWGQAYQSDQCKAIDGGGSTGSTGPAWGGPWLLGSGPTKGILYAGTNNKDPFSGPCNPGPDLWSASVLAFNVTNGHLIWGFQTTTHDIWDYDCSWWQAAGNETISGVNTPVIFKTCKDGVLFELNALTGDLIWAWVPPTNAIPRCPICWPMDPLNKTQMSFDFPSAFYTFKTQPTTGAQPPYLQYPPTTAGFEDTQTYNPTLNYIIVANQITPSYDTYFGLNASTYYTSYGYATTPINKGTCSNCNINNNNSTIFAINAQTGATVWKHFIPLQGYRGGIANSGNIVYATLSSGDILMLNAQDGTVVRDFYVGAPMDAGLTVGASSTGQEYIIVPVGTCGAGAVIGCPGTVPGDIVALTLTGVPLTPATTTTTATTTSTTTAFTTITAPGAAGSVTTSTTTATTTVTGASTGIDPNTFYGVAAVAAVFIIATGYFAMRGRKPAS